jgi:hypothetical protein
MGFGWLTKGEVRSFFFKKGAEVMRGIVAMIGAALILSMTDEIARSLLPILLGLGAYFGIIVIAIYGITK